MRIPAWSAIAWSRVRAFLAGSDDEVLIRQAIVAGQGCLGLSACEGGMGVALSTSHAGVVQQLDFPRRPLSMTVYPSMGTMSVGANPWGPSIHVLDGEGNDLTLGFSDTITSPTFSPCEECGFSLLMLPVELGKWNEVEADIASFWVQSGWSVPEEVRVLAVVSATNENPGCYSFFMSNLGFEEDQAIAKDCGMSGARVRPQLRCRPLGNVLPEMRDRANLYLGRLAGPRFIKFCLVGLSGSA